MPVPVPVPVQAVRPSVSAAAMPMNTIFCIGAAPISVRSPRGRVVKGEMRVWSGELVRRAVISPTRYIKNSRADADI
ncbi:hypothetical protein GCM10010182_79280 [Actinomadura cremea]|nr:hypothetical protein GCM10010182_79280 [Actinomadura cremea]